MNKYPDIPFNKPIVIASLTTLLILLMGCNMPSRTAVASATPQISPTALPQENTLIPPTATLQPTTSPTPTATATPAPVNIVFAAGTTAAVVEGNLQPNQVQSYTLSAGQYQPMILSLTSQYKDAYLGVFEPDGNALLDPTVKWTNWQWLLPKTEVYAIRVYGGPKAETFTLTTKVAQRITFASGASSATLDGSTLKGYVVSYAITCNADQVMNVSLNVPASQAYLDVFGLATGELLSPSARVNTWTGTLPSTEDYIIEVIPAGGLVVNYSMTVNVH
jgi:hypothetical protein